MGWECPFLSIVYSLVVDGTLLSGVHLKLLRCREEVEPSYLPSCVNALTTDLLDKRELLLVPSSAADLLEKADSVLFFVKSKY